MASSSSAVLKFTCVLLMCMVMVAPYAEAAITCGRVLSSLRPCFGYLQGRGGVPPQGCCNSIKSLIDAARTTPDRQAACRCIKTASGLIKGTNFAQVARLATRCGVTIPYKISPNIDCNRVR